MRSALTDKQIARMQWRIGRFVRLGFTEDAAEKLADRLADRDYERDDRRACAECSNFTQARTCAKASAGWLIDHPQLVRLDPVPFRLEACRVVADVLARCPLFAFATPA